VKIYSNAPEVTLYVNGKKIGVQKPNDLKIVQWNGVTLEKGNNIIEAKALVNGKELTDKCEWRY
jgi:beta-galactosidase